MLISVSRLRSAVRRFLTEGRLEDAQKRYPSVDVDALARRDPSGSQFKYLSWMAKQLDKNPSTKLEDLVPTVQYFHKNLSRFPSKDIEAYKTLTDLEDAAKAASEKKSSKEKRQETKEGSETIFEDERVALVFVGSKESCQLYGSGTKWCITMRDASYFEQYTGANVVFYFLLRKQPLNDRFDKVAFAVKRDKQNKVIMKELELYDAKDKGVSIYGAARAFPEINNYVSAATEDADRRPKGLIAKIKDGEASAEEERKAYKLYEYEPSILFMLVGYFRDFEIISKLAQDKNANIRWNVAENTSTPPETLLKLAQDKDLDVRYSVAKNTSTPPELLLKLSQDKDVLVRYYVARNNSTPPETLLKLAQDKDVGVRSSVAQNNSTPPEVLLKLVQDENVYIVRHYAKENLKKRK